MATERYKYVLKNKESKASRREKWAMIKTLKHNDLSNQLTLKIYDSLLFPVSDNQIS